MTNRKEMTQDPGQKTTGIFRIFESAGIFDLFAALVGANRSRKRLVEEFIRPKNDALLLDIGCGTGAILDFLPDEINYVGTDISEHYIKEAKRRYRDRQARFTAIRVGETGLDSRAGDFDIVLANGVLHHLNDQEAEQLLDLAFKHLQKGGKFVSLDPVYASDQSRLAQLVISNDRGEWVRDVDGYVKLIKSKFGVIRL